MVEELGDTVNVCIAVMQRDYDLSYEEAKLLFRQAWIHTFGICVLVAGKVCQLSLEEISEMLSMEVKGALLLLKSGTFQNNLINKVETEAK